MTKEHSPIPKIQMCFICDNPTDRIEDDQLLINDNPVCWDCYANEAVNNYERIVKERDELKEICREAYEVWAGSEIGEPVYASEAYAIKIIKDMVEIVSRGLETRKESTNEL